MIELADALEFIDERNLHRIDANALALTILLDTPTQRLIDRLVTPEQKLWGHRVYETQVLRAAVRIPYVDSVAGRTFSFADNRQPL